MSQTFARGLQRGCDGLRTGPASDLACLHPFARVEKPRHVGRELRRECGQRFCVPVGRLFSSANAIEHEPPDNLSPGEVGTLVDNSVDMRDITASIVDLAVRSYLVIEEQKKEHLLGLTSSKEYVFHLKKPGAEWASLKPHEQQLLAGIFSGGTAGEAVALADLHNRFYQNIAGIKNQIFGSLVGKGYYTHRPDSVRASYILLGIVAGFILIGGGSWIARNLGMAPPDW